MEINGHRNLKVLASGLVINTEFCFLGASPDGVVYDPLSADPDGLLEIKCPYVQRDISPHHAAKQKSFVCYLENRNIHLKTQHQYYYQVQGQMAVCSKK